MKQFKIIDLYINISLILFFICWVIFKKQNEQDNFFLAPIFIAYFITGGWQIISMIIHAATRTFVYKWSARYIYHWITFICIVTIPIGSFWILIIAAPFMAIFYTWLCYNETYVKMKRPLAALK